jgi:hypothetical protein
MSDLIIRRKMKDKLSKSSKIITRSSLNKCELAEEYALTLEKIYEDVESIPHFNDEDIFLEEWGISFFHEETKKEIEWILLIALRNFINQTGYAVSHVLTNERFKQSATIQESSSLGKNSMIVSNGFEITVIEDSDEL